LRGYGTATVRQETLRHQAKPMRKCLLVVAAFVLAMSGCHAAARAANPLRLVANISLSGVDGRIDHMAADLKHDRLFVAALGNNTVEVIDLKTGKRIRSLIGFHEPQGIGYDAQSNTMLIANGDSGDCDFLDGDNFERIGTLHLGDDADDVRVDAVRHHAIIGYGDGALAEVDFATRKVIGSTRFQGHPEAFALDEASGNVFVNVPSDEAIDLVDGKTRSVVQHWRVAEAHANFPMALDEAGHHLIVGCRSPARLLVYDTDTGKVIANLPIDGDTDDVYYDAARKRIYASCGAGAVDVIEQVDRSHYRRIASLMTAAGARTSLFVPELSRLYVAAPQRDGHGAEIMIFAAEP
jgi:DNA-binding beta-propeller fold protein YncE